LWSWGKIKCTWCANATNLNVYNEQKAAAKYRADEEKKEAERIAGLLNGAKLTVSIKASKNGKLFGSLTSKEVSAAISEQFGVEVDKRKIELSPVKEVGATEAKLKLYQGVSAALKIDVVGQEF